MQRTISNTFYTFTRQLGESSLNWALLGILAYVVQSYTTTAKTMIIQEPQHPNVMVFKNYTPLDLLPYDGYGKNGQLLIAVNGSIYDVSRAKNFYGPGGPYASFAGHDASRGLAKNLFNKDMLTDPNGAIDQLEDLTAEEWDSLREWEQHFASKYLFVGRFVENEYNKKEEY